MGRIFDDDDGILGIILGTIGAIGLLSVSASVLDKRSKEKIREAEEEYLNRKNTTILEPSWMSESIFESIVRSSIKESGRRKRLKNVRIGMPCVSFMVESQSKLSLWKCEIDFNDYGKISGKYWIKSENEDSELPEKVASIISKNIIICINDLNQRTNGENINYALLSANSYDYKNAEDEGYHNSRELSVKRKHSTVIKNLVFMAMISSIILCIIFAIVNNPQKVADMIVVMNRKIGNLIVKHDTDSFDGQLYSMFEITGQSVDGYDDKEELYHQDISEDKDEDSEKEVNVDAIYASGIEDIIPEFFVRIKEEKLTIEEIVSIADANNMFCYKHWSDDVDDLYNMQISCVPSKNEYVTREFGDYHYIDLYCSTDKGLRVAELVSPKGRYIDDYYVEDY